MADRVKNLSLNNPVMHRGQMSKQIEAKFGDVMTVGKLGIEVVPNPTAKRDTFIVPFSNVACFVLLDEAAELARAVEAARIAVALKEAKSQRAVSTNSVLAPRGVTKFVKNPETGVIEEVNV